MNTSASVVTKSPVNLNSPQLRFAVSLVCLSVLIVGVVRQIAPQDYQAPDFSHTYSAARALRVGENVYAPALAWVQHYEPGEPLTNQYFYAPTFALLVLPLTLLPYQMALSVWGLCMLGFLCGAVYALLHSVYTNPPPIVLVLALSAA